MLVAKFTDQFKIETGQRPLIFAARFSLLGTINTAAFLREIIRRR